LEKVLSERPIKAYQAQGFVFAIDVKSKDEALSYAQRLQAAETHYPTDLSGVNRNNGHLCFTLLDELAYHPRVLDAVEDLLGPHFSL
jgi:non-heme Fe2+,alpha-ketoglutarate-dependent halogenase|tara:strand:- start:156 stop:416 length:261 start_codon:yes stop_codon:yes gene_type:complete